MPHDLMVAAAVIHEEAGAKNAAAMCWLLDASQDEAKEIMVGTLDRAHAARLGAVLGSGPSRAGTDYLLACGIRLGVELGIAAERMRRP